MTKDDETNPRTPSKPPTNATARQPTRSLRAEETGANINIIPRPIERTQAVKKETRHCLSFFFFQAYRKSFSAEKWSCICFSSLSITSPLFSPKLLLNVPKIRCVDSIARNLSNGVELTPIS